MIILGHPSLASTTLYQVNSVEGIKLTPSNTPLLLESADNEALLPYVQAQQLTFALRASSLTAVIFAQNYGASYILIEPELAKTAHQIATNYLFDAKILCHISDEEEIEALALLGIDGVYFDAAIVLV